MEGDVGTTTREILCARLYDFSEKKRDQFALDCWLAGIDLADLTNGEPPKSVADVSNRARFMCMQTFPRKRERELSKNITETNPK